MSAEVGVTDELDCLLVEEALLVAKTQEVRRRLAELRDAMRPRCQAGQLALVFIEESSQRELGPTR